MKAIIDFLPDATFVVHKQGEVIAWNRAIEEMSGLKAEDIIGRGDYEYSLPDSPMEILHLVGSSLDLPAG